MSDSGRGNLHPTVTLNEPSQCLEQPKINIELALPKGFSEASMMTDKARERLGAHRTAKKVEIKITSTHASKTYM